MKKITVMRWLGSAATVLFLMMLIVNYCSIGFDVALYDDYGIHEAGFVGSDLAFIFFQRIFIAGNLIFDDFAYSEPETSGSRRRKPV